MESIVLLRIGTVQRLQVEHLAEQKAVEQVVEVPLHVRDGARSDGPEQVLVREDVLAQPGGDAFKHRFY